MQTTNSEAAIEAFLQGLDNDMLIVDFQKCAIKTAKSLAVSLKNDEANQVIKVYYENVPVKR